MLTFYNYLYFGLYRLLSKTTDKDIAEYSAAIFLTLILASNLFCFIVALGLNSEDKISNKAFALIVLASLGFFNYYYFICTGKYKVLTKEFKKFGYRKQNRISAISIALAIESVVLPVVYKILTT